MEENKEQTKQEFINTKVVDNHGVIITGGRHKLKFTFGKDGMEVEEEPQKESNIEILDREVMNKIASGADPKYILIVVKAAIEAQVNVPFSNNVTFNDRYKCNIPSTTWSRWINGTDNTNYDEKELTSYIKLFQ